MSVIGIGDVFGLHFLDGDPKNYMAYYRRATVYFAMGKSKSALPDLSKVIELKPDFTAVSIFSCRCVESLAFHTFKGAI